LVELAPIDELKAALSEELLEWGDIWAVRLMGKIGHIAFIPDLIRVVLESDGLDFIHGDAIDALHGIEEPGHEEILSAIAEGDIKDPLDVSTLLEHLPYPEAYDQAVALWLRGGDDSLDSYEFYAAIRKERKNRVERQRKRMLTLDGLVKKASKNKAPRTNTHVAAVKTFKRDTPKVGRNAPCPCGSGKKYKKCCLNKK